jgi:hypothetical protein
MGNWDAWQPKMVMYYIPAKQKYKKPGIELTGATTMRISAV